MKLQTYGNTKLALMPLLPILCVYVQYVPQTCQKLNFYVPHLPLLRVRDGVSEKVLQHLNGRFQQLDAVEFDHAGMNFKYINLVTWQLHLFDKQNKNLYQSDFFV